MDHGSEARVGLVATHRHSLELLEFAEEVFDQVPPLVDVEIDGDGSYPLRPLRNHDLCSALVQLRDDPVGVKRLVGDQSVELDALDQRRDPDRVVSLIRQENKPHKVAQRIGERQDFGCQAATRLADSLALSPPFAPCPWR